MRNDRMIEAIATDAIVDYIGEINEVDPPIDLSPILDKLRLKTIIGDFNNPSTKISGAFDRTDSIIYISRKDTYVRKAFTIAHELGHFYLHPDMQKEIFLWRTNFDPFVTPTREEAEANKFAAALLMPRDHLERWWRRASVGVGDIARIFGVTQMVALYRLRDSGLLAKYRYAP